jgi:threonine-phosphate decarboxylase
MKLTPEKVIHGGIRKYLENKLGLSLIDFSASVNPFPPFVAWSPEDILLESYPDDTYTLLKERIGQIFHRSPAEIAVGNGSIELIRSFCNSVLEPGDQVSIEHPTFGEYQYSARLAGAGCTTPPSSAKVRFLCNPNNPTGQLKSRHQMLEILDAVPKGGYLFVDEAFIDLADPAQSLVDSESSELFIARSLTKSFAVPGIRFGYGFGSPELVQRMEAVRSPWSVNVYAEEFALQAFCKFDQLEQSRVAIAQERFWLISQFQEMNLPLDPSKANFLLVHLPFPAKEMAERLIPRGILVRDCTSFGLPAEIRVAVRTRAENQILVEAIQACLP